MDLSGIESHVMYGKYPCRLPVWWGLFGEIGLDPEIKNIDGRKVILRIEKKFNRLEKVLAKLFRAPKEIRRPFDAKNSMLWQLCECSRKFEEICKILD